MATTYTVEAHNSRMVLVKWSLGQNETGDYFPSLADEHRFGSAANYPDKTAQAFGTWSTATVAIEGANNRTNFSTAQDVAGNAISLSTTVECEVISTNFSQIRPKVSDIACTLTIYVLMTRRGG
jgi:hypothetical protein